MKVSFFLLYLGSCLLFGGTLVGKKSLSDCYQDIGFTQEEAQNIIGCVKCYFKKSKRLFSNVWKGGGFSCDDFSAPIRLALLFMLTELERGQLVASVGTLVDTLNKLRDSYIYYLGELSQSRVRFMLDKARRMTLALVARWLCCYQGCKDEMSKRHSVYLRCADQSTLSGNFAWVRF